MLRNSTIILPLILLLSFACWLCVCQSTTAAGHDEEQVVSIFQNMLNYFNEHPFESQSDIPAPAFYDIVNNIKGRAESQASNTNQPAAAEPNSANIALSNNPAPVVANTVVPPANNAPSAQGVRSAIVQPASARIDSAAPIVAAPAAAIAPVVAPASVISPANNQPIALAAPHINRVAAEPAANEKNIVLEPVANHVDTAAPAVIPARPVVAPVESVVVPAASAAPVEQSKEVSPSVKPDVVAVPLVPVTSVAVQPSGATTIVPVIPPTLTSGTPVSSVPSTTHATAPTSSSMMNTVSAITTASLTRSMTSSVTLSRSATPSSTTTIPPISAGVSLFDMSFTKTLSMAIFTVFLLQAIA